MKGFACEEPRGGGKCGRGGVWWSGGEWRGMSLRRCGSEKRGYWWGGVGRDSLSHERERSGHWIAIRLRTWCWSVHLSSTRTSFVCCTESPSCSISIASSSSITQIRPGKVHQASKRNSVFIRRIPPSVLCEKVIMYPLPPSI